MRINFGKRLLKIFFYVVFILSIILNAGLFTILFTPLNEEIHSFLISKTPHTIPSKSDVIVVMSSNFPFGTENGLPCLSTLVRLEKGLRLYREGHADKIICFGGIMMERSKKTIAQAMKERLLLYGIPEDDIIVQDDVLGRVNYYENILSMLYKHRDQFDFNNALFVVSADQSYRLYHALISEIENPKIVLSESYEVVPDWGRRFHIFRRIANEIIFGIPYFYMTDRFSNPSTFEWIVGNPNLPEGTERKRTFWDFILKK